MDQGTLYMLELITISVVKIRLGGLGTRLTFGRDILSQLSKKYLAVVGERDTLQQQVAKVSMNVK